MHTETISPIEQQNVINNKALNLQLESKEGTTLTNQQLEKLELMRNELAPFLSEEWEREWANDLCLMRYLRARSFDVKRATDMIKETIEWRRKVRPDCITAEEVDIELNNTGKLYRGGYDKQGRPIIYLKPGRDNTSDKEKDVKVLYFIYIMEKGSRAADLNPLTQKLVWLVDWKDQKTGGGLSTLGGAKIAKEIIYILQNHYPERLGGAFIFNAPFVWKAFWKMISPFIEEDTKSKIQMVKDLKQNPILNHIETQELEKEYGGSSEYSWSYQRDKLKEDTAFPPSARHNTRLP